MCSKKRHHLVSCHKKVFIKCVTSRVPNTSPARVSRWGRVLSYRGGREAPGSAPGEVWGTVARGHGGLPVPLERATWSKNKHRLLSCQEKVFYTFVTSGVPNTSPARVGRWCRVLCYREGREEPVSVSRELWGAVARGPGGLRVPLERATCF